MGDFEDQLAASGMMPRQSDGAPTPGSRVNESMSKTTSTPTSDPPTDRDEILSILAEQIRSIHHRIDTYEVEGRADEQLLIKWTRTMAYLTGQYRKLIKDTDIDEMEEQLAVIEAAADLKGEMND